MYKMGKLKIIFILSLLVGWCLSGKEKIKLPFPSYKSNVSVEEALKKRRSIRKYEKSPLTLKELSQILWAVDGKTADWGGRTAPSAGATYPLEIFVVVRNVESLKPGLYHYDSKNHSIKLVKARDFSDELCSFCLNQVFVKKDAFNIIIAAEFERTTAYYRKRGEMYVLLEAGHAAQNVYLQAIALSLGTVSVGAFYDNLVKETLNLPENEEPLYIMPVGRK